MLRISCAVALVLFSCLAVAQNAKLPTFPYGSFVADDAHLLSQGVQNEINAISFAAKNEVGAPIFVVTIPSLHSMRAAHMTIESYARHLFDSWQIGSQRVNKGILILVSQGDRTARIELGADWGHSKDDYCQQMMDDWMVPRFKDGDYGGGVLAGVRSADHMLRNGSPSRPLSSFFSGPIFPLIGMAVIGILIFLGSCYWRRGYWNDGYSDYDSYDSGSSSSGGGSSGGGSSGGGGATGRW